MTVPEQSTYIFQADVSKPNPNVIEGKGTRIKIEDPETGKVIECLDAMTGAAVGALGWEDPDVPGYFADALKNSTYSFTPLIANKNAEALAKFLIDNSAPGAFAAALFVTSGSEANDNAMKIIRQYFVEKGKPKKTKFLGREYSYHGFTIGAMSISCGSRSDAFKDITLSDEQCPAISVCNPYRDQGDLTTEEYVQKLIDEAEETILKNDPETVASITIETLPGSTLGTIPPPPGYLLGLRKLCDKYDILFHLDEVMCGTGRCSNGKLNCWEEFLEPGQGPDLQSIGKTLGSGYVTIAGVLVSPKIRNTFIAGSSKIFGGQTYASHGINTYVALKIQEKIKRENLSANMYKMGNLMGKLLKEELADSPIVGDVRGTGGFWAIEFVKNKDTKESFPKELDVAHLYSDIALVTGISTMAFQGANKGAGDHVLFAPAFIINEDDVHEIVEKAKLACDTILKKLTAEGHY
ncbi:CIC11C00000005905 [Sungouiella intermedia]|uniref:CIC11C00000003160 n=1 Tax=Sungouiella intermedia TaxID=45354 RepID=A0A1L0BBG1_9ASCO|nr:CIC11C00000005905 [[Candida] intermedia]SGZ58706.1 CIC11C00000003160 [[Candida] intermedia]